MAAGAYLRRRWTCESYCRVQYESLWTSACQLAPTASLHQPTTCFISSLQQVKGHGIYGNQQRLHLWVGRTVSTCGGAVTFDPAQHARCAARCEIHLLSILILCIHHLDYLTARVLIKFLSISGHTELLHTDTNGTIEAITEETVKSVKQVLDWWYSTLHLRRTMARMLQLHHEKQRLHSTRATVPPLNTVLIGSTVQWWPSNPAAFLESLDNEKELDGTFPATFWT